MNTARELLADLNAEELRQALMALDCQREELARERRALAILYRAAQVGGRRRSRRRQEVADDRGAAGAK